MDRIKKELEDLAVTLIKMIRIGIVYVLPNLIVSYLAGDPKYGALANCLQIVLAEVAKNKLFPENETVKRIL